MLRRVATVLVVVGVVYGALLAIDWQDSRGSVSTRDGVTLIENDRPWSPTFMYTEARGGFGVEGQLALDQEGCVGLRSQPNDKFVPTIWGHGTELKSVDPLEIEFGGKRYRAGETISAGGFELSGPSRPFWNEVPAGCRVSDRNGYTVVESGF